MKDKIVLILEDSNEKLSLKKTSMNEYVLEGIFTEFGKENNNQRIYEEKDFLPHIENLQKKIEIGNLIGELDHPEKLEPSLLRASHIIESLSYDEKNRRIVGRIRLLSTDAGRNARALLDDGVRLSISSRALGKVVENNHVKISKLITYDLVAEPGFQNANLKRLNESIGIYGDNVAIYELQQEDLNQDKIDNLKRNGESNNMNEEIEGLLEELKTQNKKIKELEQKIQKSENEEECDECITAEAKITEIEKKLALLEKYIDSEIVEKFKETKLYTETKLTAMENYLNDELPETVNKIEEYLNYEVSETINKIENYLEDEVSESVNKIENYLEDEVSESVNKIEEYLEEEVSESVSKIEDYLEDEVSESVSKIEEYLETEVVDSVEKIEEFLDEFSNDVKTETQIIEKYLDEISENGDILDKSNTEHNLVQLKERFSELISLAKHKKEEIKESVNFQPFLKLLSKDKQKEFILLENDLKEKIIKSVTEFKPVTENQFIQIWEKFNTPTEDNYFVEMESTIPNILLEDWNRLTSLQKEKIVNESKNWDLTSPYKVHNFWGTRKEFSQTNVNENLNEDIQSGKIKTDAYKENVARNLDRFSK